MPVQPLSATIDCTQQFSARAAGLRASEIREFLKLLSDPAIISLAGGIPDPALFPIEPINDALAGIMADSARRDHALQYAASEGYGPLREWIAADMTARGMPCEVENIVITVGSQQGLDLLARVLLDPGDALLTLAPTYMGALQAFNLYQPAYVALDEEEIGSLAPWVGAKLAYFVPEFANPTGRSLTLAQRRQILDAAAMTGTVVIEDAAYTALRFGDEPQPALLALDIADKGSIENSSVVYAGTFSKTIAPGFRVGWLCGATPVINRVVLARQAADLHGSTLDQMIVHDVVADGFAAQVERLIPVYRHRRDVMLAALADTMPVGTTWTEPDGGMFVWLTLPEGMNSHRLLEDALRNEQVIFVPGTSFFSNRQGERHLRLNYTRSDDATIVDGINRLARSIARVATG